MSAHLDRVARSEAFLGQVGRTMEHSFAFKRGFDRLAEQWLRAMRLPSAADLDAVHKRLDQLERLLHDLEERLAASEESTDGGAA